MTHAFPAEIPAIAMILVVFPLGLSLGRYIKSRWSVVFGVYTRASEISQTGTRKNNPEDSPSLKPTICANAT